MYEPRSFSVSSPIAWNALPTSVHNLAATSFRRQLKTEWSCRAWHEPAIVHQSISLLELANIKYHTALNWTKWPTFTAYINIWFLLERIAELHEGSVAVRYFLSMSRESVDRRRRRSSTCLDGAVHNNNYYYCTERQKHTHQNLLIVTWRRIIRL